MLERAVAALRGVCDEIVVVLPPEGGPGPPAGVRVARDAAPGEGPLAGLHAGLAVATRELAVVAGGDMPDMQIAVLDAMLRELQGSGSDAVALLDDGRVRPLPAVVRVAAARDAAGTLLGGGRRRLRELLDALAVRSIDETTWRALDPAGTTLLDVDVQADLAP